MLATATGRSLRSASSRYTRTTLVFVPKSHGCTPMFIYIRMFHIHEFPPPPPVLSHLCGTLSSTSTTTTTTTTYIAHSPSLHLNVKVPGYEPPSAAFVESCCFAFESSWLPLSFAFDAPGVPSTPLYPPFRISLRSVHRIPSRWCTRTVYATEKLSIVLTLYIHLSSSFIFCARTLFLGTKVYTNGMRHWACRND